MILLCSNDPKRIVSKLFLSSSDIIAGINQGNRLVEFWFPERNLLGKVKSKSYKKKKFFRFICLGIKCLRI